MDENSRSQSDETNSETEGDRLISRRVVCSPVEEGQTSSSAGVVSSAVLLPTESCAEWVIIALLLGAWILSIGAFLHKWKRIRLLPVRTPSLPVQDSPKNLDAVTVVTDLDQSVIYKNYPIQLASTLQARFDHLRRSVSLRLANLPVIMATTTTRGRGANAAGPRRQPDAVMLSSFPEETSSLSSSSSSASASASGSSLPPPPPQQQEVSVQPAEAAASLPEVERSVPEVTVWLPEVTLSLADVNPARPEVVMSGDSDAVANCYGEDAPRSI